MAKCGHHVIVLAVPGVGQGAVDLRGEKEYLFLIDISGSMMGVKLEETKRAVIECLKQLDEGDKFNIIAFDHQFEVMSAHALEYNEKNMQEAEKYIELRKEFSGGANQLDLEGTYQVIYDSI